MTVPAHLSLVTLAVADLQRSTQFYEGLGWQKSPASQDTITFFQVGGINLALYGRQDLADDVGVGAAGNGFRGVTLAMNLGSVAAVDRVFAEFVAGGAVAVKPPVAAEWGGYSGYVADPDGHLWELAFNPYAPDWAAPGTD